MWVKGRRGASAFFWALAMRFAALLFDCDGVLVDGELLAMEIERAHLIGIGLAYTPIEFVSRFMGLPDHAFAAALDADRRARFGEPLPEGFMGRLHEAKRQALMERLRPVAGAAACLEALRTTPKAVASSSGAELLVLKLRLTGLLAPFGPHVHSADHVARGKPAPDLFLHAAAQLGVAPETCLVLEDSVNGVRAGVAAGMTVWGFTGASHADTGLAQRLLEAGAAWVADGFPAVTEALRARLAYSMSATAPGPSPPTRAASEAAMKASRSPSSTPCVSLVSTPVRRSFTI